MSADREALLDALRDNPDDETSLLVYADWLADHGDPDRAEYIRLQWELHGLDSDDAAWPELFAQGERLWRKNSKRWSKGLPPAVVAFLRFGGMVTRLRVPATAFIKASEALCDQPLSRLVITKAAGKQLAALSECTALAGVRDLVLQGRIEKKPLETFLASAHLTRLHTLRLNGTWLYTLAAAQVLAQSPLLAQLKTLDLGFYERRDADFDNSLWRNTALMQGAGGYNMIGDKGVLAIAGAPAASNLETLILATTDLTGAGLRQLGQSTHLTSLRRLDVSYNRIDALSIEDFVESALMAQLEWLELHGTNCDTRGVVALAAAPNSQNLKLLDVSGTRWVQLSMLSNDAARALARSSQLSGLEHLLLCQNEIGAEGASALARSKTLTSLRTLSLGGNAIGDAGATALASSDLLKHLTHLDLGQCDIRDEGARAFVRSKKVGDDMHLNLRDNLLDADTVAALRERFGERVTITHDFDPASLQDDDFE